MPPRRSLVAACSFLVVFFTLPLVIPIARAGSGTLPSSLPDREFWDIISDFSEPAGTFQSDNLVSNERLIQDVIPDLTRIAKPNRVYVGVGPEQNFTYMAALKPNIAFIVDIRRGNKDLHLMYKALFELSTDRADFISRLFSRPRPEGLSSSSTVAELFDAYANVPAEEALYTRNLRAITNHLAKTHKFLLSGPDLSRLLHIYTAFFTYGPGLQYSSTQTLGIRRRAEPTYRDLMLASDRNGLARGYLSTEEDFTFLKDLQAANLVVPLMGDFAGPKALRAIGDYLKGNGATVSAFYVSNVEEYLRRDGKWLSFCENVAALPLDETSTFIRSLRPRVPSSGGGLDSELGAMTAEIRECDPF